MPTSSARNSRPSDIPAANVTLTPDLKLTGNPKGYLLKGEVTIPRADINLQKLPKDKSRNVSPDVVVMRNGKEVEGERAAAALPVEAVVTVKLGEDITITGYGLESTVAGSWKCEKTPGVPTTGSGQLTVAGRYKAYGQDLTIKDGRLLFAGTPLNNPRLAIVAMRRISDNLETGLRISGSAQSPHDHRDVGSGSGRGGCLVVPGDRPSVERCGQRQQRLAGPAGLGHALAGRRGRRAGRQANRSRLGLDETTVEENELIGGSALTIGEYLSPRLYLSYGVGLFEPGEVIALRYRLSDDMGVRMQRGTEETRAGVEYRIEK